MAEQTSKPHVRGGRLRDELTQTIHNGTEQWQFVQHRRKWIQLSLERHALLKQSAWQPQTISIQAVGGEYHSASTVDETAISDAKLGTKREKPVFQGFFHQHSPLTISKNTSV